MRLQFSVTLRCLFTLTHNRLDVQAMSDTLPLPFQLQNRVDIVNGLVQRQLAQPPRTFTSCETAWNIASIKP